jgi:hypothetical protein
MFKQSIAAGVVAAVAPVIALAPSALAGHYGGGCGGGDLLTAKVSDKTPASGQEFVVRGRLFEMGMSGKDHAIRVQTLLGGAWQPVTHIRTDEDGRYRVRVILSTTGKRTLRVVAVGQGHEMNLHTRFVVNVH